MPTDDPRPVPEKGPFRADQVHPGDRYEISRGRPVYCAPGGRRHGLANSIGALPLITDPAEHDVGTDIGFSPSPDVLRAPDLSVGPIADEPGWAAGVPPLAVEYADRGTDERDLATKIDELLAAGCRFVWVVRLVGERRVEVHVLGEPVRVVRAGEPLHAPGVLANALPADALWDRNVSLDVSLRNLLRRQGFDSLESVRAQALTEGAAPLVHLFERRLGRALTTVERAAILQRLASLGPERVGDVVLDLTAEALAAWLADPAAR